MSQIDLKDAALIVVDFQEDFAPPHGALAVPDGRTIAPTINRLLQLPWALRVATQDWHPPNHTSFASNHQGSKPMQKTPMTNPLNPEETQSVMLCPDHCIQGTPGAELVPELDVSRIDHLVRKGQDDRVEMYSAFRDVFENPPVVKSDLASTLKAKSVKKVFVTGLAMDFCVNATALHAAAEGYQTTVLADAAKGINDSSDYMDKFKDNLKQHHVEFLTSTEAGL